MKNDDKSVRVGVEGDRSWTITQSATKVMYLDPSVSMINLDDIVHHTSQICRFTGGTKRFYSVAQHSIMVGKLVQSIIESVGWDRGEVRYWNQVLAALLHDAAETYTNDIASPLKDAIRGKYKWIEHALLEKVYEKFGVPIEMHNDVVKIADNIALQIERFYLMPDHPDWPKVPAEEMHYEEPEFIDPISASKMFRMEIESAIMFRDEAQT